MEDYEELESQVMMLQAEVKAKDKQIAGLDAELESMQGKVVTWQAVKDANEKVCKERNELLAELATQKDISAMDFDKIQELKAELAKKDGFDDAKVCREMVRDMIARDPVSKELSHEGDPCIHCGTPHDEVSVGNCPALDNKTKPMSFVSFLGKIRQRDCDRGQPNYYRREQLQRQYEVYKENPNDYFHD